MKIIRPLVFLDTETTGTDLEEARIVEIALIRVEPTSGEVTTKCRRLNPECHIPRSATAVHGIADDDVKNSPTFRHVARSLADALTGVDIAGQNVRAFDLPLLAHEFARVGLDVWPWEEARVVDTLEIHRHLSPGSLAALVKRWCGREHEGAHGAQADAEAVIDVLGAMLDGGGLPRDVAALEALVGPKTQPAEPTGKLVRRADGALVLSFGRHRDTPLSEVPQSYLRWLVKQKLHPRARALIDALVVVERIA